MNSQKFCLKWDHFRTSVTSVFNHLRRDGELVDITLCCEGQRVKAHRMMLSACSPYFRELLKENPCQHPVFFLKDTSAEDLRAVIEFVYNGEVNVSQGQLASFIKTAEMLQIRGLSGEDDEGAASMPGVPSGGGGVGERAERRQPPERVRSPPAKRRRRSGSPPETPGRPVASPAVSTPASATGGGAAAAPVLPRPQAQQQQHQPEEITVAEHSPVNVKVEADLAKTEDDPCLEAALGRVVYEGADAELSSLTADDSLGEAGPSGGLGSDRGLQADQPPYRCWVCGQSYTRRDTLTHHLHSHRGNTGCPVCGKQFSTTSSRNRHMRVHHPTEPLPPPLLYTTTPPTTQPPSGLVGTSAEESLAQTWSNFVNQ